MLACIIGRLATPSCVELRRSLARSLASAASVSQPAGRLPSGSACAKDGRRRQIGHRGTGNGANGIAIAVSFSGALWKDKMLPYWRRGWKEPTGKWLIADGEFVCLSVRVFVCVLNRLSPAQRRRAATAAPAAC